MRRGIWAETAPDGALRDPATWRLLQRHDLEVAIAVRPHHIDDVTRWVDVAHACGVRTSVWPMIHDDDGRWLSVANVGIFSAFVREVRAAAPGSELVLDLEPPFPLVRGALDGRPLAAARLFALARDTADRREGQRAIVSLCAETMRAGSSLMLGVMPFVLFDDDDGRGAWSRFSGSPAELGAARLNVMLYSSLIEGYSRGSLRRADVRSLLYEGCRGAVHAFGARAAVSLGSAGIGALGDEPVYPDPGALADDVALATVAGVRDQWLFDLGGVLSRGAPEPWLAAFVGPADRVAPPRPTARSRGATALLWAVGRALGAGSSALSFAERGTFARGLW